MRKVSFVTLVLRMVFVSGLLTCILFFPQIVNAATTTYSVPNLNVQIPGLDFTEHPIYVEPTQITVPFFAVYIYSFYKIILGVGLVATAIMLVWGGMLYVYGSTGLQVSDAKKKIIDSVVGLIILLGSYLILANINPNLIGMRTLQMYKVPSVNDQIKIMNNSTNATSGMEPDPVEDPLNPIVGGECTSIMAIEKKRLNAFVMSRLVPNSSFEERINRVAKLLVECKINLGPCNLVANRAWTLAGVGDEDVKRCLVNPKQVPKASGGTGEENCFDNLLRFTAKNSTVGNQASWYGMTPEQTADCLKYPALARYARDFGSLISKGSALSKVRTELESADRNYPKKLTDKLKPGDWIWTYNANPDCTGRHSEIFLGWVAGKKGVARVLTGDMKTKPKIREECFTKECNVTGYSMIISIFHPDPKKIRPL